MVDDAPAPAIRPERGLVRHRLLRLLDRADVAMVVAPAGSGKTTLLQQFADRSAAAVTWHRLVPDDADPGHFGHTVGVLAGALAADAGPRGRDPVLIVDDYQSIVSSPAEAEFERLIARRGRRAKVLIASRQRPSMNVSRAEFGTVAIVSTDDLRFRSWRRRICSGRCIAIRCRRSRPRR